MTSWRKYSGKGRWELVYGAPWIPTSQKSFDFNARRMVTECDVMQWDLRSALEGLTGKNLYS